MTILHVFVLQRLNKLIIPDIEEKKGDNELPSKTDDEKYASNGSIAIATSTF